MSHTLDPTTALLVVDLQKGIVGKAPAELVEPLVATNARLADAFHEAGLPVVWIHATGLPQGRVDTPLPAGDGEPPADFTDLHDDLRPHDADKHVYKDKTTSAFPRTDLDEHLKALGVTSVVVTGIATGIGVESTARSAYDAGYHVVVAHDATVDGDPERGQHSLERTLPSLAVVASCDDVIDALKAR